MYSIGGFAEIEMNANRAMCTASYYKTVAAFFISVIVV